MPIGGVMASEEMAAPVFFEPMLNIAHNHAALEEHFHRECMAHRKGATRAREGTPSYIVRGKGNRESFARAPTAPAGRWAASRPSGGWSWSRKIDEVIDNQPDLVEVLVELRPLAVVKG